MAGTAHRLAAALTRIGPGILDDPHLYGRADPETTAQMRLAVEDPQAHVRIYRAVPPEHLEINPGDWVTLSRAYAHEHGYAADGAPDWPVVYADVPASAVFTDGNDPSEYGYNGDALRALEPYREGAQMPAPEAQATSVEQDVGSSSPPRLRPSPGATAERRIPPSNTHSGHRVAR